MDLAVVAFSSFLAPALGSAFGREVFVSAADQDKDYDSAFHYDYESLRIGGLVFAVALFLLGIALIVIRGVSMIRAPVCEDMGVETGLELNVPGRKCTCSKSSKPDKSKARSPDAEAPIQRD